MASESPVASPTPSPVPSTPASLPRLSPAPCESSDDVGLLASSDDDADDGAELTCVTCAENCQQPRVLSCLHVGCTDCLQGHVEGSGEGAFLLCPACSQRTLVGAIGVAGLPPDDVMICLQDVAAVRERRVACTSCRARETAVARCSDCATFLCPNCVTAHQYMRCFENHKVLSFDELESGGSMILQRPIVCDSHSSENLKYFCTTCQVAVCSQCVAVDHARPGHEVAPLGETLSRHASELRGLMDECRSKATACERASAGLEGALGELQMERDNARGLVEETFHSYKAVLTHRKEELLRELDALHSSQELGVMELCHGVERAAERTQHACAFADRLLAHGSAAQVARVRRVVRARLLALINNAPRVDAGVRLEFRTDATRFRDAVARLFGSFVVPDDDDVDGGVKESPDTSLDSPTDSDCFALPPGVLDADAALPPTVAPVGVPVRRPDDFRSPPLCPPAPLPSQRSGGGGVPIVSAQTIKSIASSIQNLPPVVGGGGAGRGGVERSLSRSSYSPAMSDSGISVDAGSSGSGSNQSLANLAALAKLGAVNVNGHGQITFDGQVIQGLNVNSGGALTSSQGAPRVITPPTPTGTQSLASLLSSVGGARPATPQIAELATLLSQSASQIIGGSVGTGSSALIGGTTQPPPPLNLPSPPGGLLPPPSTPVTPATPTSSYNLGPPPFPVRNNSKMSAMQIRCKFGQLGPGKGQFNSPHGFCLGLDEDIIVADTNNHRVQVFEKTGEFKYQFGIPGREEGQLWYPRKVAVIRQTGKYVVCDRGNERSRMQIFTKNGHFVKKIAIRYIDIVAGLAITQNGYIVAVDSVSPTVFCISEAGDLIKWFDCSEYMREPSDIAISNKEYFVCDFKGHCVIVFNDDGEFMRRIGCENITNFPNGIDISDAGDVLIGDSHGNRFHVGVFQRDGSLIGEFECPYVKVSRCCGLKITSEGYVVTLAKNNHHVLVLNTLYIA